MIDDRIGAELVMRPVDESTPVPGLPDRTTRVVSWVGWHFFELTGVTVPAVVAMAATPWAWLVSGVVGAGWTVHEVRIARENAAIRAGRDLPAVPAAGPEESADVDGSDAVAAETTPAGKGDDDAGWSA